MTTHDLVPGEFVKISIDCKIISFAGPPTIHTSWWFARFIAWVDQQAVIEDATGARVLVDATQVHTLDHVVESSGGAAT